MKRVLKRRKTEKDKKAVNPVILLPKPDAPLKKWHPTHLRNAMTIRQYLSRICNRLEHGEIEVKISNGIANICNVLLRSLQQGELQVQINELAQEIKTIKRQLEI